MDRHRLPKDRQPLAERHHLLLVQPQKCAVHQLGHVLNAAATQQGVSGQGGEQIAHCGFDLDVLAAAAIRQLAQKMPQQQFGALPPQACRLFQCLPGPLQCHHQCVARSLAQPQIALATILIAPVTAHAAQQLFHDVGSHGAVPLIAERLTGFGQMQGNASGTFGIGGGLAHQGDQRGFKPCGLRQPLLRMPLDGDMDKDCDRHVIAGNPERLEIGHCLDQHAASQSADPGQLIGGNAMIGRRVHQVAGNIQKLLATGAGDRALCQDRLDFFQVADPEG